MEMYRSLVRVCVFISVGAIAPIAAYSHHAASIHYDMSDIAEVAGRVTSVDWANPHSIITLEVRESGETGAEWRIEAAAAAMIMRSGMTRDAVAVGDSVRAAGFRGRRNKNAIFLRNFMLADGREWLASGSVEPRWSSSLVGAAAGNPQLEPSNDGLGIFKVWSLDETTLAPVGPPRPLWNDSYPLTDMAREAQATWGRGVENPYVNCRNGMPAIMDSPIPMEFVRQGEDILLRFEELDARRVIFMGDTAQSRPVIPGPYGHSTGRWDGESLVVRTTAIDWDWFDQDGIPLTKDMEIVERFTPGGGGRFLNYTATVDDDAVFTEPVVLDRRWVFIPGEEVQDYDCRWDESGL